MRSVNRAVADLERFHFDGGKTGLAAFAVAPELVDRGLQGAKRQRRAADAALDDLLAHLVDDLGEPSSLTSSSVSPSPAR